MRRLENRKPAVARAILLAFVIGGAVAVAVGRHSADPHRAAVEVLAVLLVGMIVAAAVLVPWKRLPAPRSDQAAALATLPNEHVARSKQLFKAMRPTAIGALLFSLTLSGVIGLSPLGSTVIGWLGQPFGGSKVAQVILGLLAIMLAKTVAELPFAAWKHKVFVRFGLSSQPWKSWVIDQIKGFVFVSVLFGAVLACFYFAVWVSPQWWWLWATVLIATTGLVIGFVYPVWIAPLFNKFTPLEDGPLRDRLLALAKRDDVKVPEVYVVDGSRRSREVNAAVAGFGKTRRILVFDNLLQPADTSAQAGKTTDSAAEQALGSMRLRGATHDEIEVVVAHELSHAKYQDSIGTIFLRVLQLAMIMCGFFLLNEWEWMLRTANVDAIYDGRALGLLLLVDGILTAVFGPLNSLFSRRREISADWHALVLTNKPDAFESVWRHIVEVNIADTSPSRLGRIFATHPPILSRIAMARAYKRMAQTG